jgi:hypothetical protein
MFATLRIPVLDGFKYAKSHEWAKVDGEIATVGISDHAQVGPFTPATPHGSECMQ